MTSSTGKMAKNSAYPATEIAKYFIFVANAHKKPLTNKKLQKLLYYAQAWSVAARKKPIFADKVEAWVHGPAIREVYLEYKKFGFDPIQKSVQEKDIATLHEQDKKFLDEIWRIYGKFDAAYLEQLSHSETPWIEARDGLEAHVGSDNEITLESMERFYTPKLKV